MPIRILIPVLLINYDPKIIYSYSKELITLGTFDITASLFSSSFVHVNIFTTIIYSNIIYGSDAICFRLHPKIDPRILHIRRSVIGYVAFNLVWKFPSVNFGNKTILIVEAHQCDVCL